MTRAGCHAGHGDASALVGPCDRSQRGRLPGTCNGAYQRHRSRIGDDASHKLALFVAEREVPLGLDARDAVVCLCLGEDELTRRPALSELRDALLSGIKAAGAEVPLTPWDDLLESEKRVRGREQGVRV
jgi:hypothetical protein